VNFNSCPVIVPKCRMSGTLSLVVWFFSSVSIKKLDSRLSFFFLSLSNRNDGKTFAVLSIFFLCRHKVLCAQYAYGKKNAANNVYRR